MTTTLISHTVGSLQTSLLSAFTAHFVELCAGASDGLDIEARYDGSPASPTANLAAIGLNRSDVAQAALTGRCN